MLKASLTSLKGLLTAFLMLTAVLLHSECVRITILATADIHGHTEQLNKAVAPAVAREFAAQQGAAIYVDIGDTVQGTLASDMNRGKGVLKMLNRAGCTLWVPGNHELEFGFEAFKRMVNEFPGTVLAANLHAPEVQGKVKAFKIVELNGVKIAFIGLMLKDMNNCFPVAEKRFQTSAARSVLQHSIKAARRAGAEVIVLLRHAGKYGGKENLATLTKNMPEIDLVIGAHTHEADAGTRIGNFWYVQAEPFGRSLLKVTIKFDKKAKSVRQIESELLKLREVRQPVPTAALQGKSKLRIDSDVNFAAMRMQKKFNSDLALYAVNRGWQLSELMKKSQPRMWDYYRAFPHYDPVITVKVSAGELQAILQEYLQFAHRRKQVISAAGFAYTSKRGKLQTLAFDSEKECYTLAISAYAAAGAGGQLPQTRRILKGKINYDQAENAAGILEILTQIPSGR